MNTQFRRSKMLALLKMAGDALRDYVMFLEDFDDVLRVCGFVGRKSALCRTLGQ